MSAVALPRVSGGHDEHGHLEEFRTDPIGLMQRVRDECGDVGTFQLAGKQVVLLSGSHANEFFFRAGDDDLDQAKAYPFMTPIFGEGVVFDASPERRKEMLHNAALRGEQMKGHAATIEDQVRRMIADWGEAGEIDLLDFFAELTIYTSSACLIGKKFRDQLDGRFAKLYHELERGTDPLAYVDPYLPIESFRRRDEARNGLVALVADIMNGRIANPPTDKSDRDMLDVLIAVKAETGTPRFSADEITGMFISMMFAGHHTSSGTASWTLIELMRHRDAYAAVIDELDELYGDGRSVSFHALRQIPQLENVLKETLRLHPPLIILMRVAKGEFEVQGHRIHEGDLVAASPAISNRIPEDFPADRGVGRRSPALTQDVVVPAKPGDVVHHQEVARKSQLGNDFQLMLDLGVRPGRALGRPVTLAGARHDQRPQPAVLGVPVGNIERRQPRRDEL